MFVDQVLMTRRAVKSAQIVIDNLSRPGMALFGVNIMKNKLLEEPIYKFYIAQLRARDARGSERLLKRYCKLKGVKYRDFKAGLGLDN